MGNEELDKAKKMALAVRETIAKTLKGKKIGDVDTEQVIKSMTEQLTEIVSQQYEGFTDHVAIVANPGADVGSVNVSLIAKTEEGKRIVREIERSNAEMSITSHHAVEEILPLPNGYNLYVVKTPQGVAYFTDEVTGGMLLWNPAVIAESTINIMLQHHYTGGASSE